MDPNLCLLGHCLPTSISIWPGGEQEVSFYVRLDDCYFRRMVTRSQLMYLNELTYTSVPGSGPSFSHPVMCIYERPDDWAPPLYSPVWSVHSYGGLDFFMGIMKDDFRSPADSATFPLGSLIPLWAGVQQQAHMPLLLLLEECVASTTPELHPSGQVYPIITNGGCLLDSKMGNSSFQPRAQTSEIKLFLQAFKFALGLDVYVHCKLVAWDPQSMDVGKKACHYSKQLQRWQLLDDPSQSALCSCCDSECRHRKRRSLASGPRGLTHHAVVGPLTITEDAETLEHNASVKSLLTQ
ncbi:zona pellucida sperm-binding protein 3-like [Megalops cyprinoides]|uniref:zona pellucida sperm-binding protein 3-like n=1 Tax=Megalops cyprinoides TaxID=118141 RepID=UPI0018649BD3|nr:zona pellucida sperm-binding protein 3-like [Megalops cyprinoides]